ncbi:glycoside hydrolase family 12 protein [Rickenella mellea]|uniref:Glycoside hydrolase family 12 protein n=1 Tax=Rickenella mellea TaxID=50990 RepID=A0A4Y7PWA9_9AGAM|nr:glycoside hydrolase family 12 protein [Rickenella mellea]
MKNILSILLFAVYAVSATPVASDLQKAAVEKRLEKRGAILTGQWQTESEANGYYTLFADLWGAGSGTGSQSSQVTKTTGTTVSWWTKYSWSGGPYNVKSYSSISLNTGLNKQLSAIKSIPSTWHWSYTQATNVVADVSYDLWLSNSAGGSHTYEVMVWLSARGGAGPAGSQIATVTVNGGSWKLYRGTVGNWTVFSFVTNQGELTNFSQDLKPFFNLLSSSYGVPKTSYFVGAGAGTEPFTGTATLTTSAYSMAVN